MKHCILVIAFLMPIVVLGFEELTTPSQGGALISSEPRGKQPLFIAVFAREWQQCIWTQVTAYKASESPLGYAEIWDKALQSCEREEPRIIPPSSRLSFDDVKLIIRETMELIWQNDDTTFTVGPENGPFPDGGGYIVIADDTVSDLPEAQAHTLKAIRGWSVCIREAFKNRNRQDDSYGYDDVWEEVRIACSESEQEAANSIPYPYGTDLIVNMKKTFLTTWEGEVWGK